MDAEVRAAFGAWDQKWRRVSAASPGSADDYVALFGPDDRQYVAAAAGVDDQLDRQRADAASQAASLSDDQIYDQIYPADRERERPSASHPNAGPIARPRPAA